MRTLKKNALPLLLALALILALGRAAPTFAWLSAQSETVVNTFSAGAISLRLDEAKVDGNGQAVSGERVTENNYRIAPGAVLDKDPTVTVLAGSEPCYVFLYLENTLPPDYFTLDYSDAWIEAAAGGGSLYVYEAAVDAGQGDVTLPALFTQVAVSGALDAQTIADLGELTLKVQAYAVQSAGIAYEEALSMAKSYFQTQFGLPGLTDTGAQTDFPPEQPAEEQPQPPAAGPDAPAPEENGAQDEPDGPTENETEPPAGEEPQDEETPDAAEPDAPDAGQPEPDGEQPAGTQPDGGAEETPAAEPESEPDAAVPAAGESGAPQEPAPGGEETAGQAEG